jgi:hypothetical protein
MRPPPQRHSKTEGLRRYDSVGCILPANVAGLIPKEAVRYQEQYSERFVEIRRKTVNFLKTVITR